MNEDGAVLADGISTRFLIGLLGTMIAIGIAGIFAQQQALDKRLDQLERWEASVRADRFTQYDAARMEQGLQAWHNSVTPPREVVSQLRDLDERVDDLERFHKNTGVTR